MVGESRSDRSAQCYVKLRIQVRQHMMPHVQQRTQWHIERFTVGAEMNPTIAHAMWNRHRLHVVCVTLKIIM